MAENVTVARPYADAVFQMARDAGTLAAWSQTLALLEAIVTNSDMAAYLANPELSSEQRAKAVLQVAGDALAAEGRNFVHALADNGRLPLLPEIRELFDGMRNAHEGVKEAAIESAFPMDAATTQALVADLERKFGCRIQAKVTVAPDLIGGVRIAIGDRVMDASVRGKLLSLSVAIKN